MYVIDSCGWIEYFNDGELARHYEKFIRKPSHIITPATILYEVYRNIILNQGEDKATVALGILQKTNIVPITAEIIVSAVEISLEHALPESHAIIYATAKEYDAKLITSNSYFRKLPDVIYIEKAINPALTVK